ncbi:unnamed protein product [Lupinus luteus]|uniref:Uncharacterized protein n=1 Tax=Lupinus luteus TaxID=3873 RepID=A0AAV1WL60_LUPLU
MERLDISWCLVATRNLRSIDRTRKVLIGDLIWEVRMVEDVEDFCRWKISPPRNIIASVSTSSDSEYGESWPEKEIDGMKVACSVDEDDDVPLHTLNRGHFLCIGINEKRGMTFTCK